MSRSCSKIIGTGKIAQTIPKLKAIGAHGIKSPTGSSDHQQVEDDVLLPLGTPGRPARMVLFIRDPLEIIISGYQYHLVSSEKWLRTSGYQAELRSLGEEAGLAQEFFRVAAPWSKLQATTQANEASLVAGANNQTGYSILGSLCRLYTKSQNNPRVFVNRMEDSTDDFDAAISPLIEWLGLGHSIAHYDLESVARRKPQHPVDASSPGAASTAPEHFSRVEEKEGMRHLLMAAHERRHVVHMHQACLDYRLWDR